MRRIRLFAFLLSLLTIQVKAQNQTTEPVKIMTPSPDATALGKFGNTPVSMYTGTTNVSVQIFQVKEGMIEMPIALNYATGGLKVSEIASWVGAGWSLSNSAITRVVYGIADEYRLNSDEKSIDMNPVIPKQKAEQYMQNIKDSQLDVFYFNFLGRSGRFVLDDDFEAQISPYQKLKIVPKQSYVTFIADGTLLPTKNCITEWEVTDENGIKYTFSDIERSQAYSRFYSYLPSGPTGNFGTSGGGDPASWNYSVSGWNLTKIVSPLGDSVIFKYNDRAHQYDTPCEAKRYILKHAVPDKYAQHIKGGMVSSQRQFNNIKRLSEIEFSSGKVIFEESERDRADLIGDKYLQRIVIKNSNDVAIRSFTLGYEYLLPNGNLVNPADITTTNETNLFDYPPGGPPSFSRRLMLTSINECDPAGVLCKQHRFYYHRGMGLPSRSSVRTDHWGYYTNSNASEFNILPTFAKVGTNEYVIYGKDPNLSYAQQGALQKIVYPTGGSTSFTYELNSCISTLLPYPIRQKPGFSLSMDYSRFNNLGYAYEEKTPDTYSETGVRKLHYKDFEINDIGGNVTITIDVKDFMENPGVMGFYILNKSTNTVSWEMDTDLLNQLEYDPSAHTFSGTASISLVNGQYRLYHCPPPTVIQDPGTPGYIQPYSVTVQSWKERYYSEARNVGGLRLSKVVDYDPFENRSVQKVYKYIKEDGKTSGELLSDFIYLYDYAEMAKFTVCVAGMACVTEHFTIDYKTYGSSPVYPLLTTQGSHVGYSRVEELIQSVDGQINGKTVYTFSSPNEYPDFYAGLASTTHSNFFPFAPADTYDWMRGRTKEEAQYRYTNGAYHILHKKINLYSPPVIQSISKSRKCDYSLRAVDQFSDLEAYGEEVIADCFYNFSSGYSNLVESTEVTYSGSEVLSQTTQYGYDNSYLLTNYIKTKNSRDQILETYIKYPVNYGGLTSSDPLSTGVKKLFDSGIIGREIERSQYFTNSTTVKRLLSSTFTSYKTDLPVIDKVLTIEEPGPVIDFTASSVSNGAISTDARYKTKVSYDTYTNKGSILQYHKDQDVNHSYVWDAKSIHPIAHAVNASSTDIFYTGFEENGTVQVSGSPAKTGKHYKNSGAFNFTTDGNFTNANPGLLRMSYWYWSSGQWNYSGVIAFANTISQGSRLDEVRVFPAGSEMTTYTYDELIGMTSATDVNNVTRFYDYDTFGRIRYIIDSDGNILKKLEYHYAQDEP